MDPTRLEHGMNAGTAIDLAVFQEKLLDVGGKAGIFSAMLARLAAFVLFSVIKTAQLTRHRTKQTPFFCFFSLFHLLLIFPPPKIM